MKKLAFIFTCTVVLFACSHKTTPATTENTSAPSSKISAEAAAIITMEQKGALFAASCAKCHKLPDPGKYTKDKWVGWLDRMAPKAKLTAEQKAQIFDYVSANAKAN